MPDQPRAEDDVTEHVVIPAVQGDRWVCESCGRIVELSGDGERWVHTTWGQPFALPTVMVTFARHLLLRGLERVEWEDFPEVGEHDWNEVMEMAKNLATVPTTPTFQQAYDVLAARASADA